jgi:hypothetical protein
MHFRWLLASELICLGIGSNMIVVEQTVIVLLIQQNVLYLLSN